MGGGVRKAMPEVKITFKVVLMTDTLRYKKRSRKR